MIVNMLPPKQTKTRIELPNLSAPEYLTLTRQMQTEYRQMEDKIYRQGIQNAHALFFKADTETPTYNDYVGYFGPAVVLPTDKSFSPEAHGGQFCQGNIRELKKSSKRQSIRSK